MAQGTNVQQTVGGTPLVTLDHLTEGLGARVAMKLESRNPGGSIKDRIGLGMVLDAERRGVAIPGTSVLIEPTSGNTGIALALVGAARGYQVILTMPESMSIERRKLLAAFGAKLVLTPKADGMRGAVEAANDLAARTANSFILGQFDNPANPEVHYHTTGPEIAAALAEEGLPRIGAFLAGVGTGGTVSGTGRYLREHDPDVRVFAVEPAESPIIAQALAGETLTPGPHGIQGIGANFIPKVLDLKLLSGSIAITSAIAIDTARRVAAEEGVLVGISSGANIAAALRLAAQPEYAGTTIVTVAPDTGERYLSTPLWEGYGN